MTFKDRRDGGRALAGLLASSSPPLVDALVLGLPRGGVPVAWEVARALGATLDVLVVRKLGHPGQEEYAMGAIAPGGVRVKAEPDQPWPVSTQALEAVVAREAAELARREKRYRGSRGPLVLAGRTVVLVDDGLATGATMRAAVAAVRAGGAQRVVVAVPVASKEAVQALALLADEVVSVHTPEPFRAVGLWYEDFGQTGDDEVCRLLSRSPEA